MGSLVAGCVLGLLLGMRHALEPDHLAAVSTLVAEHKSARSGLWLGAAWGLGHTLGLVAVGGVLAALRAQMPDRLGAGFECAVGVMLIVLGARAVVRAWREGQTGPDHTHHHGPSLHRHSAPTEHVHLRRWTLSRRPLAIGLVHGLAGSGAITALVLAQLPTTSARLVYIGLFGMGSIAGMACLTALAGLSFWKLRTAASSASRTLLAFAGTGSALLGAFWLVTSALEVIG